MRLGTQVREENVAWVDRVLVRYGKYPIRVGKDKDRPVLFQDSVAQGTYSTQHNSPHLGTQGRVE